MGLGSSMIAISPTRPPDEIGADIDDEDTQK